MNFKPMFDRVLIKQDPGESVTKSGFIIPGASVEKANTGTVVAVGPGKTTKDGMVIPLTVKADDKIMYMPGSTIRVKVDGHELLVLQEENIIAIIE